MDPHVAEYRKLIDNWIFKSSIIMVLLFSLFEVLNNKCRSKDVDNSIFYFKYKYGNPHWCQVPYGQSTGEVPTGGGKGEEADVPGGMPPAAPALLPLCRLLGWTDGGGGNGNLEEVSQLPVYQVEATLLKDVWLSQY